jgi:hypothetical protein
MPGGFSFLGKLEAVSRDRSGRQGGRVMDARRDGNQGRGGR